MYATDLAKVPITLIKMWKYEGEGYSLMVHVTITWLLVYMK